MWWCRVYSYFLLNSCLNIPSLSSVCREWTAEVIHLTYLVSVNSTRLFCKENVRSASRNSLLWRQAQEQDEEAEIFRDKFCSVSNVVNVQWRVLCLEEIPSCDRLWTYFSALWKPISCLQSTNMLLQTTFIFYNWLQQQTSLGNSFFLEKHWLKLSLQNKFVIFSSLIIPS